MTDTGGNENKLSAPARWAAVAVLGLAGVAGVMRAWVVGPTAMLDPTPGPERRVASDAEPGPAIAEAGGAHATHAGPAPASLARRINVNTASAAELDLLPGIGPALAAMIIEDRKANGPYATLDDLDRVPRIGPKTVAKLAPFASVE